MATSRPLLRLRVAPKGMRYLPLWRHAVPPEFQDRPWDFGRFSRGERFVSRPIPRAEFDEVLDQVERWGLDEFLKERGLEKLTYRGAP